jgi:hypothetical protein
MTITLLELRNQARQRADMEDSEFVEDSELTSYINSSIAELHDILIQAYSSDYYIESVTFNTVVNQADYDLPNGTNYSGAKQLYKLRGVDAKLNGQDFLTIRPFNFNERNRYEQSGVWNVYGLPTIRYRMVGNKLKFTPYPDQATEVKLWYIPVATKLINDSDTLDDLNQYSEYVVVDAAIKMRIKEETDVSELMAQKKALVDRITYAAQNRDVAQPESISDIYAENDWRYFWSSDS